MKLLKPILGSVGSLVILFDAAMIYETLSYGWPRSITATNLGGGRVDIQVGDSPFNALSWMLLALFVGIHIALAYLVWRTWLGPSRQPGRAAR